VKLDELALLEWVGFFGLSLVWIGRHLEDHAIAKSWAAAQDLFSSTKGSAIELVPSAAVVQSARTATNRAITHFVLMGGQRLAHFFRNSIQNKKSAAAREPSEPSLVVEMVLKEAYIFDAQLGRVLGDPRKPRGASHHGRVFSRNRNSMELEMERMWAKKLQVFASVPLSRNGALTGILKIAFRALSEYWREETLTKFGLQQVQLDCAMLAEVARDSVEAEDASMLDSLLGEVLSSAKQRCVEPLMMDIEGVHAICDDKKKNFKFG